MAQTGTPLAEVRHKRTTRIHGQRAMEKHDTRSARDVLKLIVADRFLIEIEGRHTTMEAVRSTAESLRFDDLAALRSYGIIAGAGSGTPAAPTQ